MVLIKVGSALLGAHIGLQLAYFPSALVACSLLWPNSNLCGLPAVFVAFPIGIIGGAIAGWMIARRTIASRVAH